MAAQMSLHLFSSAATQWFGSQRFVNSNVLEEIQSDKKSPEKFSIYFMYDEIFDENFQK